VIRRGSEFAVVFVFVVGLWLYQRLTRTEYVECR
jgi:hypothetical protein